MCEDVGSSLASFLEPLSHNQSVSVSFFWFWMGGPNKIGMAPNRVLGMLNLLQKEICEAVGSRLDVSLNRY